MIEIALPDSAHGSPQSRLRWFATIRFWRLHRLIGRFETGRALSRRWRAAVRGMTPPAWMNTTTMLETLTGGPAAEGLRRHGYHAGLELPAQAVQEIYAHARRTPCRRQPDDTESFLIDAVRNGMSPRGRPVAVADVDPEADCPVLTRLAGDAKLVELAARHLGYSPRKVVTRLYWSPVSDLPDDTRRWNGQTIDYHYDIERGNALYVYFYLTDADQLNGAHVLVAGSHLAKPLRMKLAPTQQPSEQVLEVFGAENVVVMEGRAGFGFLEDPACFHKVLPPRQHARLMLQFRYT